MLDQSQCMKYIKCGAVGTLIHSHLFWPSLLLPVGLTHDALSLDLKGPESSYFEIQRPRNIQLMALLA